MPADSDLPAPGWCPSLSEFLAAMRAPPSWSFDMDGFGTGIDNVHLDVHLSPRLTAVAAGTVRKLFAEELAAASGQTPLQQLDADDLERFRRQYVKLCEQALERHGSAQAMELLALLQLALLRLLLELTVRERDNLLQACQHASQQSLAAGSGRSLALHEQLVVLKRQGAAIDRRVLKILFRQLRKLEAGPLGKLRAAVSTDAWPLPMQALFNPVLLATDPVDIAALSPEYPIAALGNDDWLEQANRAVLSGFADYLPASARPQLAVELTPQQLTEPVNERRDQGILRGFLATELLLCRFMAAEEYQAAQTCWLDEPANMRRLLQLPSAGTESAPLLAPVQWGSARWLAFRQRIRAQLHRRLQRAGLVERIVLCYWLPALRAQLGAELPLALVAEHCAGTLSRRRLAERLAALNPTQTEPAAVRVLDRCRSALKQLAPDARARALDRFAGDFVALRRDLKLAYKTYQAMDRLRLVEQADEIALSRANASLWEFVDRSEAVAQGRRVRAHAVVKADIRGSTRITDELVQRDLNPASHFSLNLFDPVNRLLPELGAEKLFVEGDAVILALYDYEGEGEGKGEGETSIDAGSDGAAAQPVARACGLARSILHVVAMENVRNRRHGLPQLELGLGIAYSPREPNFLYDDGRRIMISTAINTADRLSGCSAMLRRAGVSPPGSGHRAMLVKPVGEAVTAAGDDALLAYNVNGILLEQQAFFQLQRELMMRQARLSVDGDDDGLYFLAQYQDLAGRGRRLAVRCARVRNWDGTAIGAPDDEHRHYFEVIADAAVMGLLRGEFS
jgi:hypothetical protein